MSEHTDQKERNPLGPFLVGALLAAYLDARFYSFDHHHPAFGVTVLVSLAIFVSLFFLRSRYAWHAAGIVFACILPVTLLLTYYGGYMAYPLTWGFAIFYLVLYALLAGSVWGRRLPYFRYIATKRI